jgi:hypothetical protein
MTRFHTTSASVPQFSDAAVDDPRLDRLVALLPNRMAEAVRWLRQPSARWARIPAAALFTIGGLLSILPFLGLWMLPLGMLLLAEDFRWLRLRRGRMLDWVERRYPRLFSQPGPL